MEKLRKLLMLRCEEGPQRLLRRLKEWFEQSAQGESQTAAENRTPAEEYPRGDK
jgi:hypothetical protein